MSRIRVLLLVLAFSVVVISGYYGRYVPFSRQWPLYEGLRTTAAIIFAVIGAWLAISYPERLKVSLGTEAASKKQESPLAIPLLMTPIAHSTGVLASVLIIGLMAPLIGQIEFVADHVLAARGVSYATLASLTLWQVWTVFSTLAPASAVKDDAEEDQTKARHAAAVLARSKVSAKNNSD